MLRQSRRRHHLDSCSDAVAVRFLPSGLNDKPIVAITAVVPKYIGVLSYVADDQINIAIVIYVPKGGAAPRPRFLECIAGDHPCEMPRLIAQQKRWFQVAQVWRCLLDRVHDMRLRYEEVLPAIIVVVEEVCAPTRECQGCTAQA